MRAVVIVPLKQVTSVLTNIDSISGTRKFDRGLTRFVRDDLHWLDVQAVSTGLQVFTRLGTAVSL